MHVPNLIKLIPKDVKLTFVGGQAINFWTIYFHEIYPKKLEYHEHYSHTKVFHHSCEGPVYGSMPLS
jgi:hypothetical protein